jgi:hypothetical protein
MADSPWEETQLWRVIRQEIVPHFEPIEAWILQPNGSIVAGKPLRVKTTNPQRSKDDLGLDHYEGRSWRGFHHPLVMSAIA